MGFDLNSNTDPKFRQTLSERDREYLKNCRTCTVAETCGGWSVFNDGRWCDGPGPVCFDGCRAICSRSPEKVDFYTRFLPEHERTTRVDEDGFEWAVPTGLSIVGKHPWKRWAFERYPDAGFQVNATIRGLYLPLATISVKRLFYPGRNTWSPPTNLRERFGIHPATRLALTATCLDDLMDVLDTQLDVYADKIASFEGVDFVFAPNFSVYVNYPRLDNLFRNKFVFMALDRLQERGVKVVPVVYPANATDFKNIVAWLRDNKVRHIMTNGQTIPAVSSTAEWLAFLRRYSKLREHYGEPLHLFMYGATGGSRMESVIKEYGNDVTILDAKAHRLAEFHKDMSAVQDRTVPVLEHMRRNVRSVRESVALAKGQDPFPALDDEYTLRFAE